MEPIVLLAIVAVVGLFLIVTYNRLVTLRQRVKESWADIDVQLKRRYDLIPNLVETVKGYAKHESATFEAVTKARAEAVAASAAPNVTPEQRAQVETALSNALINLKAVAEAYPELQAVKEFKDLSENLTATEDKIAFARRFYNGNIRDYNTALQVFPTNLLAGAFGFTAEAYFEITDPVERQNVQVKF